MAQLLHRMAFRFRAEMVWCALFCVKGARPLVQDATSSVCIPPRCLVSANQTKYQPGPPFPLFSLGARLSWVALPIQTHLFSLSHADTSRCLVGRGLTAQMASHVVPVTRLGSQLCWMMNCWRPNSQCFFLLLIWMSSIVISQLSCNIPSDMPSNLSHGLIKTWGVWLFSIS